jgi:hypothetical protein
MNGGIVVTALLKERNQLLDEEQPTSRVNPKRNDPGSNQEFKSPLRPLAY